MKKAWWWWCSGFKEQPREFFEEGIHRLASQWNTYLNAHVNYF
jgi:hypothetical protein